MPQGLPEIPEMFRRQNDPRSQQALEIGRPTLELPSYMAGPPSPYPFTQSGTSESGLRETPESPEFAIANAMTGGGAFAPALLKGLFMNAMINKATDVAVSQLGKGFDEGTLTERMKRRGYQIPERLGESHMTTGGPYGIKDYGPESTLPISAKEGWYTPEHFRQAEAYSPYRLKKTEALRYPNTRAASPGGTSELYDVTELAHPSLLRTSSAPILPRDDPTDLSKQFGYSMHERNPLDLIWHGLATDVGTAGKAVPALQDIRRTGGMNAGWFNRTPAADFGPLFIGADPKDLPPANIQPHSLRVDPSAQIVPHWSNPWGEETVSGQPVPETSIHPSKLAVIDQQGNLLGSVADFRPGLEHGEERIMQPKAFQRMSTKPMDEFGSTIGSPQEAHAVKARLLDSLKNIPSRGSGDVYAEEMRNDIRESLKSINEALRSEMAPVKNWATQHLPDITKLFEEAE